MDYLDFGDTIDYNKFNALVYLLRKFKKLTSELELGAYDINTDYGNFHFTDGFVPVGNNWILEDNVTVTGSNVLLNSFYTFVFTVVDVNTSGVVNKRLIRVTSESTGETGNLSLLIPSDLINNDEVILPIFDLEVVFDEHEYYTPLPDMNLSLSVDKRIIEAGEVATITGLLTDSTSTPIENVSLPLIVDGTTVTVITDSTGEFNYVYTGTGTRGKVLVSALGESVFFYDGLINIMGATVTGNNVSLGKNGTWLFTTGDVVIDWGDGTSDTVNNPNVRLSHTYADGLNEHLIIFDGTVTSIGNWCFRMCSSLTSIIIPDSVTSIGNSCFLDCTSLVDYELYWETQPIQYNSQKMPVNTDTVFTIPYRTTSIYTDAGYPSARLVEREPTTPLDTTLSIASDKQTIYTDETIIITGTLLDENNNPVKQASVKLYDGNTLLDTLTTDNAGAYTKTITGLSSGSHSLHTSFEATTIYNASTSSNITITVQDHNYNLVLSSDTPIIQKTETAVVNALLSIDGSAYSSQSLSYTVKHGSTTIDTGTVTTGSDGKASISYTGSGVGDVDFTFTYNAQGTLLQETYELQDCWKYGLQSSDSWHNLKSPNVGNVSNGEFTGYNKMLDCDLDWSKDWSIECDYKQSAYRVGFIICDESMTTSYDTERYAILLNDEINAKMQVEYKNSSNTLVYSANGSANCSFNTFYHLKFVKQGTTISVYYDDILIDSRTNVDAINTANIGVYSWDSKNGYLKNLKIKTL